jgi:hypothetical protein
MSTTHFNCAYTFIFFILTYLYNNFNKPNDFFIPYSIYNIVSTPEYKFMYKTYTLLSIVSSRTLVGPIFFVFLHNLCTRMFI